MAQRRMFSPDIVNSDAFLEMPPSTQALYFQLGMKADDDGFVNPKMVMRMMGSSDDELKVLLAKRFVLPFENGVIVIKHWKINNLVRKDWYKPTIYLEQKSKLLIKENGSYTLDETQGRRLVNEPLTQVRLGKVNIINSNASPVGSRSDSPLEEEEEVRILTDKELEREEKAKLKKKDLPQPKEKKQRVPSAWETQVNEFLEYYLKEFKEKISDTTPIVSYPIYRRWMAQQHIKALGIPRLKELLDIYFKTDELYYRKSAWSIKTFLTGDTLNQLNFKK